MAFAGDGSFSRVHNWVSDRNGSVKILADRHDEEDDGFATALSLTICRDGQSTTTARIPFSVGLSFNLGTAGAPSVSPIGDPNTGIYSSAADKVSISCGGSKVGEFTTAGLDVTGALTASGGFSVTGNLNPSSNDAAALGTGSLSWSDLFLASGAVINFNNGNLTLTHSAGLLTNNAGYAGTTGAFSSTVSIGAALTYGGVVLSNSVTGTGSMVLSAGPTFTGTAAHANGTFSGTLGVTGATTLSSYLALTGSPVGAGGAVRYISGGGTSSTWYVNVPTGGAVSFNINEATQILNADATKLSVPQTTASTSTTTGALTVGGGLGVVGVGFFGSIVVSHADISTTLLISGTTKGVRFGTDANGGVVEGVDTTGAGSYQPLYVGGTQVLITRSGATRATFIDGLQMGAPTGGDRGTGSINLAGALYANNTQVISSSGAGSFTTLSASGAITYGGVTLSNAVTGTGNMVLSASPTFTGVISAPLGSASAPSYTLTGDSNTGIYSATGDEIDITTGGTVRFSMNTAVIQTTLPWQGPAGSAGTPAFSFGADTNTGIFANAPDDIVIATGGVARLELTNTLAIASGTFCSGNGINVGGAVALTTTWMKIAAAAAGFSQINLVTGGPPTSPLDGDIWLESNTNTGLKIRLNGVTKTVTVS